MFAAGDELLLMDSLSEAQRDVLYNTARQAIVYYVNGERDHDKSWRGAFVRMCDNRATIQSLIKKGAVGEDAASTFLNKIGIAVAKRIYQEVSESNWDIVAANGAAAREESEARAQSAREEWKAYLATLPVPTGYQTPIGGPSHIEWRTEEWCYAPTISLDDKNAPFMGEQRYDDPQWQISMSTGSQRDANALACFRGALNIVTEVMKELEERPVTSA